MRMDDGTRRAARLDDQQEHCLALSLLLQPQSETGESRLSVDRFSREQAQGMDNLLALYEHVKRGKHLPNSRGGRQRLPNEPHNVLPPADPSP